MHDGHDSAFIGRVDSLPADAVAPDLDAVLTSRLTFESDVRNVVVHTQASIPQESTRLLPRRFGVGQRVRLPSSRFRVPFSNCALVMGSYISAQLVFAILDFAESSMLS
ncbi:hypothetical protein DL96DRAFT_1718444 [Flagelloscypha sp. PMI_526]|nr:hypothetical protein DL96DRAFT_1718444 [Flagelloscypha sp. PMI_526]